ncbi:MAG TPA: helix-turn-helix transcriptional regulator [Streptosporangiaceae bacterium]|jgi:transcriptional regulator with XRE-family HTH domain
MDDRPETARAHELADFLRTRRARLRPADVGLPEAPRRRTPGLRREEVAQLAAISATYYTFLEQGREVRPSRQVLDALAGALRLDATERGHLYELAEGPVPSASRAAEAAAPGLAELVDRLDPGPAYVTGRYWDVLAANRAARVLWTDWPALPPGERNLLWWMITNPAARAVFAEWEKEASAQLGRFRAAAARHPGDPRFAELADALRAASPEAREWWSRHEIAPLGSGAKLLRHPGLGAVELRHTVLQSADDPEQKLVAFTADASVLARIAELIADRFPA